MKIIVIKKSKIERRNNLDENKFNILNKDHNLVVVE
jgi:hypothetical protein